MPNYYFPTQETRKKLIEELAQQNPQPQKLSHP